MPYSPLGHGFLTGTLSREQVAGDLCGCTSRMGDSWDANQKLLTLVAEVARRHDATNARVAPAWILQCAAQLGVSAVPIPDSRKSERNLENLGALDLSLDDEGARLVPHPGRGHPQLRRQPDMDQLRTGVSRARVATAVR
ncbi:aldo/keto reductase [Brevibacterium sp. FAM 27836]|uniref:aldo/keto reductase n=1 Tax=Brevibacterium sp. FAM 27836 TaxID=3446693 RepID=UPI003F51313A